MHYVVSTIVTKHRALKNLEPGDWFMLSVDSDVVFMKTDSTELIDGMIQYVGIRGDVHYLEPDCIVVPLHPLNNLEFEIVR